MKLYGIPRSRAFRCLLALEETGIPYELVATDYREGCKTEAFRKLNPNAKIPVLVDGDLCLWESLAINLYLFRKSGTLWPKTPEDEARLFQWTLWTATEAEPAQGAWFYNTKFLPPEERDPAQAEKGAEKLRACLAVLDQHLADRSVSLAARRGRRPTCRSLRCSTRPGRTDSTTALTRGRGLGSNAASIVRRR
ncbi:MAG: glutathione S-transferase family protein [Acetobacteraceae bacterium]|nr:glutathione S-transferase family protein [Acetobacteraceae bacterium]